MPGAMRGAFLQVALRSHHGLFQGMAAARARDRIRRLQLRPFSSSSAQIQELTALARQQHSSFPEWLRTELKTDHAGEFGAVEIYRGALWGARLRASLGFTGAATQRMMSFSEHHMKTEQEHLDVMRALVPEPARTRLLGLWTCAARSLGFFPAVLGARSLYWTVRCPMHVYLTLTYRRLSV